MMIIVINLPARTIKPLDVSHAHVLSNGRCVLVAGDVFLTFSWVSTIYRFSKQIQVV